MDEMISLLPCTNLRFSTLSVQSDKSSERVQAESQTGEIQPEILSAPLKMLPRLLGHGFTSVSDGGSFQESVTCDLCGWYTSLILADCLQTPNTCWITLQTFGTFGNPKPDILEMYRGHARKSLFTLIVSQILNGRLTQSPILLYLAEKCHKRHELYLLLTLEIIKKK